MRNDVTVPAEAARASSRMRNEARESIGVATAVAHRAVRWLHRVT